VTDLIARLLLALLGWLDPGCLRCACRPASPVPPPPALDEAAAEPKELELARKAEPDGGGEA
jgi:hypothetical protein